MTDARTKVAVLGTGIMGAPMARHIAGAGFSTRVWNRTPAKAQGLGAEVAASPAEAVKGADVVLTMLNDGPSVLEVMTAAGPGLSEKTLWVQASTIGVEAMGPVAALAAERGLILYDAPVLGTKAPAEAGTLTVLATGPLEGRPVLEPILSAFGSRTIWLGEQGASGTSSRLKLALNSFILTLTHAVGESLNLAEGLGVDPSKVLEIFAGGPLDSGYLQAKGGAILKRDFAPSFTVDNAAKDARLVVEAARGVGLRLDLAEAGAARMARASAQGHGAKDMAASALVDVTG